MVINKAGWIKSLAANMLKKEGINYTSPRQIAEMLNNLGAEDRNPCEVLEKNLGKLGQGKYFQRIQTKENNSENHEKTY